jgi:hypothetical protein
VTFRIHGLVGQAFVITGTYWLGCGSCS